MNINGEVREGSVEIDSADNVERFKTGSGDEEVVEIRDFQSVSDFVPSGGKKDEPTFSLCAFAEP